MVREKNLSQLPKGWNWARLGDVAMYLNGRAFKPSEWQEKGRPIIRIQNLNNEASKYNYSNEEFEERYKVLKGDLLFAWSASLGAYIWKGEEAWLNQHIFKVIPRDFTDKKYLYFLLEWTIHELYSKAHGSGMVHVTKGKFEATLIPLPPTDTQQAIVAKLEELFSELDKGIEQLKAVQQQLKIYRQAVLKWAFEGKFTNENLKDGELPEKWESVNIGDIFEVFIGSTPKRDIPKYWGGDINWVSSGEIAFCKISNTKEKITAEGLKNTSCKLHPAGTVMIAMIGEGKTRGQAAILKIEATHNQNTAAIRVDNKVYKSELLYYYLVLKYEENRKIGSGNNQKALNKERVKSIPIHILPIEEQQKIVQEIESRLSIADKMEETVSRSLQQVEVLRQSILKMAFEGRLVVTDTIETIKETTKLQADKVSEITL